MAGRSPFRVESTGRHYAHVVHGQVCSVVDGPDGGSSSLERSRIV